MAAPHATPEVYARAKLSMLRRRWEGIEGNELNRYAPRIWPGVPNVALLGLTASSMGLREVVGEPDAAASALGLWGVERPALRTWLGTHRAEVRSLLGRDPPQDEAGFLGDPGCQTVVGLLNYKRHLVLLRPVLGELYPSESSVWGVQLAAGAYSTGEGTVSAVVMAHREPLAATPEPDRRARLAELVAGDLARGVRALNRVPLAGHWQGAAFVVRSGQRIACGRLLGENVTDATNAGPAWWGREASPDVWSALAAVTGSSGASSSAAGDGSGAEWLLVPPLAWAMWKLWNGGW